MKRAGTLVWVAAWACLLCSGFSPATGQGEQPAPLKNPSSGVATVAPPLREPPGEEAKGAEPSTLNAGLGEVPAGLARTNPRQSFAGFVDTALGGDFRRASFYLDLGGIPPDQQVAEGKRLSRRLVLVLAKASGLDLGSVSENRSGSPSKSAGEPQDRVATLDIGGARVDILMSRVASATGHRAWVLSQDAVSHIDSWYAACGYGRLGEILPLAFFTWVLWGLQLWQWVGVALILASGWAVAWAVAHVAHRALLRLALRTKTEWDERLVEVSDAPLVLLFWGLTAALSTPLLDLSHNPAEVMRVACKLFVLAGFGLLLFRAADAVFSPPGASDRNPLASGFYPIIRRFTKILVAVFILLGAMDVVGIQVMGLLAGLGLGGLALAFAAQKTLENLFGAVSIAADKPFKVGDSITIDDVTGTVEDVGLRSTRVRTLQRTVAIIPNGMVMATKVINFSQRDRILYNPTIAVSYGATSEQLVFAVDEIKKALVGDPRVYHDPFRVRFTGFGASGLTIEVMALVNTTDWQSFTGVSEDLNFKIWKILESAGLQLSLPSQAVYLSRVRQPDRAKLDEIASELDRRRRGSELTLPDPPFPAPPPTPVDAGPPSADRAP